ncbi:MAG: 30S ribosomal protein S5 [Patescibacteria group bacterium]
MERTTNQTARNRFDTRGNQPPEAREFEEKVIAIDRVSRTVAGGRRMRFRALVVIGNRKGKIGMGIGKGNEVVNAIAKANTQARKHLIVVPIKDNTIPFNIETSFGSTRLHLKSARPGTSVIAGGVVRQVVELAGIGNIVAKIYGSTNQINSAKAVFAALEELTNLDAKSQTSKTSS